MDTFKPTTERLPLWREPYTQEKLFFRERKDTSSPNFVAGMTTEDGKVTLNPYFYDNPNINLEAVYNNEVVRLALDNKLDVEIPEVNVEFEKKQKEKLLGTDYETADSKDVQQTLLARLVSGEIEPINEEQKAVKQLLLNSVGQYLAKPTQEGQLEPGNIPLHNRPKVSLTEGGTATVRSEGFNLGGKEVLLPTVSPEGRIWSRNEAVENYQKTGQHLGIFDSPQASTNYAKQLSKEQGELMKHSPRKPRQETYVEFIKRYRGY